MPDARTDFVVAICKPSTLGCCRYLCMSSNGWECAKLTDLKATIDRRVKTGHFRATGDNCNGRDLGAL
jgi:hypothetical protein